MRKIMYSLIACFVLVSFTASAQRDTSRSKTGAPAGAKAPIPDFGSVSGKVTDAQGNPVGYATVTLLRRDSSVANGDLTQDDGSFNITPTGTGKFRLRIESIGTITKLMDLEITPDAPNKNLGKIKLTPTETALKQVDVVGERPVIEMKVDKKVFNVEKNITAAGGSVSDVLQNVPSVSVDADGNVSLRGNTDVTILIDGRPATLLGSDVASALQSLPAGSVDNIEVITNPSAKYDAQGTAGIINIVTKKDGRLGINGNITLGVGSGDKYNGNAGINIRKGKWTAFANGSFRINNTYNDVTTLRSNINQLGYVNQSFATFEEVPRHFNGSFNSVGVTYDPDKNNSFSLTENINFMEFGFKDNSNYYIFNNPTDTISSFRQYRNTDFKVDIFSLSTNANYKHKFRKKDEELTIDVTGATSMITRTQNYLTSILADTSKMFVTPTVESAPATGGNNSVNVAADFTDPLFTANGKLGLGIKSQFFGFNSSGLPQIDTGKSKNAYVDSTLLADYNYTTSIQAAYVNWSDQVGKFGYQAGLRVEDAIYSGTGTVPRDTSYKNSFLNLFPSAFVSYKLTDNQSIYLSYSRRTNRPDFRSLLPFKDLSNPGTVNMGNPTLLPEFIDNLEFSYNKSDKRGDNFIVSAYYSYTRNLTQRVTRSVTAADSAIGLKQEVGELLSLPLNIASGATYGLEGTGHFQFTKWWDATVNANFFQNYLSVDGGNTVDTVYHLVNSNGFSWFAKGNTSVKLPKGFTIQANVNYESPKVIAQGTLQESWWADLAVKKGFLKNKITLVLNVSDIFNTRRFVTDYSLTHYYENINRVKENRIANFSVSYRFGKADAGKGKKPKMEDKSLKPDEKSRENNLKEGDDSNQGGDGPMVKPNGGGKN